MVILNSLKAARDLLDKRSSIYSDRPRFVLLAELCVASDFSGLLLRRLIFQYGVENRIYSYEIVSSAILLHKLFITMVTVDLDFESIGVSSTKPSINELYPPFVLFKKRRFSSS